MFFFLNIDFLFIFTLIGPKDFRNILSIFSLILVYILRLKKQRTFFIFYINL